MKAFETFIGKVVAVPGNDIDTDQIIPAQFLTSISREGYGKNLFRSLKDQNPQFPFNLEKFHAAEILCVGKNFACGSSREHAVWAIQGAGIRVVIGESFADIFSNNSANNGLLLISLPEETISYIMKNAEDGNLTLTVNLREQTVQMPNNQSISFDYDSFRKHCLLNGLDDLDYILDKKEVIAAYRKRNQTYRFYSTLDYKN